MAAATIAQTAESRLDPADLINAAIDALIRERCELPLLSTLRTLAGTAHRLVNAAQWQQVYERLSAEDIAGLDVLLASNPETQESPFAVMCRGAGKATRNNLKGLITHYQWLNTLVDPHCHWLGLPRPRWRVGERSRAVEGAGTARICAGAALYAATGRTSRRARPAAQRIGRDADQVQRQDRVAK